ncbi:MAG: hypothetical protein OQK78_13265 [Gammaproteobacteria bacterium]|nr:hypothetical protein [Gammaproteobacteria bacterium]MCW8887775.1 hypothetical protein [Gammaproteobacteria bacterium]
MAAVDRSNFGKFPWSFLMIIYLMVTYFTGIPLEGVVGYIFIALGMFVLFIEFFKSGDVSSTLFLVDQLFALAAVITSTVLLTFLFFVVGEVPNFFYWFGYAVILGDAILSPFNAFRMALRNFGVAGQ